MIVILLIYEACNEMRRGKITHRGERAWTAHITKA